ncbi:unnamed protein product, partial [Mesorhabditis spiculigera]
MRAIRERDSESHQTPGCGYALPEYSASALDLCKYYELVGKLHEHPECLRGAPPDVLEKIFPSTDAPRPEPVTRPILGFCPSSAALIQCTGDLQACPLSGQICVQSDGNKCCQIVTSGHDDWLLAGRQLSGYPEVLRRAEPGDKFGDANLPRPGSSICNQPLAVGSCTAPTVRYYYDAGAGRCTQFMYSGCGGNANNFQSLASCQATCGSSGITGTPSCPADANTGLNCLFAHADACNTDSDCLGRENTQQPSCCMTTCGYKICYQY